MNDTMFIIFEEEDESAPMYQIINECYNLELEYWQVLPTDKETDQFDNDLQDTKIQRNSRRVSQIDKHSDSLGPRS